MILNGVFITISNPNKHKFKLIWLVEVYIRIMYV